MSAPRHPRLICSFCGCAKNRECCDCCDLGATQEWRRRTRTGIRQRHASQLAPALGLGSLLWFDTDGLGDTSHNRIQYLLERAFADCPVPLLLTGERPWRREPLLRTGRYAEIELSEPTLHHREQLWSHNFPELRVDEIEELAARYSVGGA